MNVYVEDWEGAGFSQMTADFGLGEEAAREIEQGFEILHAYYCYADYSGEAFVIARSRADGSLFEVNGSHCSCHGLEDQWDLEATDLASLIHRHKARALPGIDGGNGEAWLLSMACERELAHAVPEGSGAKDGGRAKSL